MFKVVVNDHVTLVCRLWAVGAIVAGFVPSTALDEFLRVPRLHPCECANYARIYLRIRQVLTRKTHSHDVEPFSRW